MTAGYTHLVGADEVKSAGRLMSNAAETMSQAALNMDGTCMRLGQQLDAATEAMNRLAAALEKTQIVGPEKCPECEANGLCAVHAYQQAHPEEHGLELPLCARHPGERCLSEQCGPTHGCLRDKA